MKLQALAQKDIETAAKLLTNYWKSRNMRYSIKWARDYLRNCHEKELKGDYFFAIKDANRMVGTISVIIWENRLAELRDFVIKKEFQGKGYGKEAVKEIFVWCRRKRIRKIIALGLPKVQRLLRSFGFEKEGLLKNHFVKGENLAVMSKQL